ncbi:MAG: hypothetical protein AAGL90_16050 [Pseudomonadota bacterium]
MLIVNWPNATKRSFGDEVLQAEHNLHQSDLFADDGLAQLLEIYPREHLDIWTFGEFREGCQPAIRGRAPKLSGKDILEAVKRGDIWLNLRRISHEIIELRPLADRVFQSLESATRTRVQDTAMNLLISSPNMHVHYHLDISMVALLQVRGRKQIWLYPRTDDFAMPEYVEAMVHKTREEDLPYQNAFDREAVVYELEPGMGLSWPQLSPHRIQNADCLNVSISCEFQTRKSAIRADAIYTNAFLRQNMNFTPDLPGRIGPRTVAKAVFGKAYKRLHPDGPNVATTPVTFELDVSKEKCVKPLWV